MSFYSRIKKYIFLLASLTSIVLIIHIVAVYLYDGSEEISEKGGSFSVGFVDSLPTLDPTLYGTNTKRDFVLSLLYRGLLQYNPDEKTIEGDLGTCDLGKKLTEIRCTLRDGMLWSDGTKITIEDVLATYSLLAETEKNKRLQSGLSKFAITREGNSLVFRNSVANTENIEFLTIPIIKKSITEQMRSGEKNIDFIFSGDYVFDKKEPNPTHFNDSIHLVKSPYSTKTSYDRLILRFYQDSDSILKDLGSINIVYPDSFTSSIQNERFRLAEYTTPDFTSAFINTGKHSIEARRVLSKIIANTFEDSEKNPFGIDSPSIASSGATLDESLEKIGYFRKNKLPPSKTTQKPTAPSNTTTTASGSSENSTPKITTQTSTLATTTPTTNIAPSTTIPSTTSLESKKIVPTLENETLQFFKKPGNKKKTAMVFDSEIELSGIVPAGVDTVLINGYELKAFQSGNKTFLYRAKTSIGNLRLGRNVYELKMYGKSKLLYTETLELYTTRTQAEKLQLETSWSTNSTESEKTVQPKEGTAASASSTGNTSSVTSSSINTGSGASEGNLNGSNSLSAASSSGNLSNTGNVSVAQGNQISTQTGSGSSTTTSTGSTNPQTNLQGISSTGGSSTGGVSIAVSGPAQTSGTGSKIEKEQAIVDTKLYTASGTQAKLTVHYIPSAKNIEDDVQRLKNQLETVGFMVNLVSVDPNPESVQEARKISSKTYDIFVASVNLGFIGTNLTPYFHSGQAQDGFNFSLIKNPTLDPLLEEISTKEMQLEQKVKVLRKISELLKQESVVIPLRLNRSVIGVDILMKDFTPPNMLPESKHLKNAILRSYLKTIYIIDFDKKSFTDFIHWSQSQLFLKD